MSGQLLNDRTSLDALRESHDENNGIDHYNMLSAEYFFLFLLGMLLLFAAALKDVNKSFAFKVKKFHLSCTHTHTNIQEYYNMSI